MMYFRNPRLLAVLLLGFSSGLPIVLVGATLQAWFTEAGISVVAIGALTLVGMPYIWKFLWAPVVDRFTLPWLGRRRGWIMLTQLLLAATLCLLANLNPAQNSWWMAILAIVIAFISASQDIAIDAYRTDILLPEERGVAIASYIFTYRMATLVSGGLALIIADYWGWRVTYDIMAALMLSSTVVTYFAPEIPGHIKAPLTMFSAVVDPLKELFRRESVFVILGFIICYKFGDAFAQALMSNFLLHGLGFSLTEVGLAYKTVGLVATIMGAFIAGIWMTRLPLYYALLWFGLAQAFSNFMFVVLASVGKNLALMTASLFIENFCAGMSTAALFAFLTAICDVRFSATQYAIFSALASLGRVLVGPVAGIFVAHMGWVSFYSWAFVLSFPGLIFLGFLRGKINSYAQAI